MLCLIEISNFLELFAKGTLCVQELGISECHQMIYW